MKSFNLSEWALAHRNFVLYIMFLVLALGAFGYNKLGQSEDPPFTFKVMLVQAMWPGATTKEIEEQVVNRIEKVILESPHVETVRSFSQPGAANITVIAKDTTPSADMPEMFYQVRKRVEDIAHTLPQGVQGPLFNDEFGDTFGNIFALIGDGFSMAQLRDTSDDIRKELLLISDVAKVLIIGEQQEQVFVEISNQKLANLGFSLQALTTALSEQNEMVATGNFETVNDRIFVRTGERFKTLEDVQNLPIKIGDSTIRLSEVATVRRGYVEPQSDAFRYMGEPALGIGVSMKKGGDIIQLGKILDDALVRIESRLPIGMELHRVNDQPRAVNSSIREFLKVVLEAVVIVLAVSFLSLGLRAGAVVAFSIPLVLAGTFFVMYLFDIGLHKISLGSLILALGLLVDDAIIAIEMMSVKLEEGWDRVKAASFAYKTTAFPMLTGTFVTAAGFLPIATAASSVGEYTRSIFQVVTIALILSWFAAVILVPYLGYRLIPEKGLHTDEKKKGFFSPIINFQHTIAEVFYKLFRKLITVCVKYPLMVIILTLATFVGSLYSFQFVQQQFFPDATRLEVLVDLKLAEGSSIEATQREVEKVERFLDTQKTHIDNYVSYVGTGSPRFYLPLDQQLPNDSFAQFVITTKNIKARESLREELIPLMDSEEFSHIRGRVLRLENGPPVGYPVQFRVSGDELWQLRSLAEQVASIMRENPHLQNVHLDWSELSKAINLEVDTEKATSLGITQTTISQLMHGLLQGVTIGEFREYDQTIPIKIRGTQAERDHITLLESLNVPTDRGTTIPLGQIARIKAGQEDGIIWHRNRTPTITIRGDIYTKIQAPTITAEVESRLGEFRDSLPLGYRLETGGAVEESAKGNVSIAAGFPLFIVVMLTVLMIQLQSFQRVIMVVLTAPFGLIGVVAFLILFDKPFGFVAMLGTIALSGMIMRNSVILIDQIDRNIEEGLIPRDAIIEAAVRRFRPIMLTALAAILAMIPLSESVFFGPMAIAIMGGLLVATVLTLLFLPAIYAIWYKLTQGKAQFMGNAKAVA
ncbi:MAG: RND efflux transporter [uncultured Thiotrichaceae bacterium]|uniref:RND efflux transporter n=1 Tax=uncultured Thiotrichaceae bacterium TaxID=298394 RepID=A0A6S6S7L8_9GAMM|nr:MAG: RND efflux transporter [uncultured Thiotrichaceae bacterium]